MSTTLRRTEQGSAWDAACNRCHPLSVFDDQEGLMLHLDTEHANPSIADPVYYATTWCSAVKDGLVTTAYLIYRRGESRSLAYVQRTYPGNKPDPTDDDACNPEPPTHNDVVLAERAYKTEGPFAFLGDGRTFRNFSPRNADGFSDKYYTERSSCALCVAAGMPMDDLPGMHAILYHTAAIHRYGIRADEPISAEMTRHVDATEWSSSTFRLGALGLDEPLGWLVTKTKREGDDLDTWRAFCDLP